MRARWIPLALLFLLALAPAGAAEEGAGNPHGGPPGAGDGAPGQNDTHPHGGPPGQGGADPGDGGQGDGEPEGDGGDGGDSTDLVSTVVNTADRGCRLVEWDGGGIEPALNPLLGVLVVDPEDCVTESGDLLWDRG